MHPQPRKTPCRRKKCQEMSMVNHPKKARTYTDPKGGEPMTDELPTEEYEKQVHELQTQVRFLDDEIALLRRRLSNSPRQVTLLEERLLETRQDLAKAMAQNEKLANVLEA